MYLNIFAAYIANDYTDQGVCHMLCSVPKDQQTGQEKVRAEYTNQARLKS
jgi:hypothetical protein